MAKAMPLIADSYDKSATKLRIRTTSGTGELLIDYISVTEKTNGIEWKGIKPKPIDLPLIIAPGFNFRTDAVKNISINGRFIYFVNLPVIYEGIVYAPVREISSAMGFKLKYSEGNYVLSKNNLSVLIGPEKVTVGGVNASTVNVIEQSGVRYIDIAEFAKALGYESIIDTNGDILIHGKEE